MKELSDERKAALFCICLAGLVLGALMSSFIAPVLLFFSHWLHILAIGMERNRTFVVFVGALIGMGGMASIFFGRKIAVSSCKIPAMIIAWLVGATLLLYNLGFLSTKPGTGEFKNLDSSPFWVGVLGLVMIIGIVIGSVGIGALLGPILARLIRRATNVLLVPAKTLCQREGKMKRVSLNGLIVLVASVLVFFSGVFAQAHTFKDPNAPFLYRKSMEHVRQHLKEGPCRKFVVELDLDYQKRVLRRIYAGDKPGYRHSVKELSQCYDDIFWLFRDPQRK